MMKSRKGRGGGGSNPVGDIMRDAPNKGEWSSAHGTQQWAAQQQEGQGNQAVLGMIGAQTGHDEIAAGRPVGRMVEWVPKRDGVMKCRAVFPPGTKVNVGDVGTIADKWGYRVERWEEINDNVHIEFVTMAPQDQFAWGNEVILGQPPPDTVLEEVQQDESEGKGLLAAAGGMLAASLLAPPTEQQPGAPTAGAPATQQAGLLPTVGPQASPGAPAAAGATGLAAGIMAAAMGTPTAATAAATPAAGLLPGLAPRSAAAKPGVEQKAKAMEEQVEGKAAQDTKANPDQQIQQSVQAFVREAGASSPSLSALQRIATSTQGTRLWELLGRDLGEREVENVVRACQQSNPSLLALLEDQLYPMLGGGAQSAWDAVLDEEIVQQAAKAAPADAAKAGPTKS